MQIIFDVFNLFDANFQLHLKSGGKNFDTVPPGCLFKVILLYPLTQIVWHNALTLNAAVKVNTHLKIFFLLELSHPTKEFFAWKWILLKINLNYFFLDRSIRYAAFTGDFFTQIFARWMAPFSYQRGMRRQRSYFL